MPDIKTPHPSSPLQTAEESSRARFVILGLLFVTVVINYLDRSNLSIAAPKLSKDLGIDKQHMGLILSAFGWTYALMQIPGGWLVDKIRPRVLYAAAIALWSLATIGLGFAGSFVALIVLRLAVGAFEAPAYPINNRVVTTWFPDRERASAIGFYTSGQFVGLAFLAPALMYLQETYSWKMVFLVTGVVGLFWALVWFWLYREPGEHPSANNAEIALIRDGGGLVDIATSKRVHLNWHDLTIVLRHRKLWGIYLGQFFMSSTLWFFLTWFPTYLVEARGFNFLKAGFAASVPFLAAFLGVITSGLFSDFLLRKGYSQGFARKTPIITGLLISTCILGANYVESPTLIITCMALAFFGNGLASITWSLVSGIAPERLIGLTGGVFNFIGNLSAITVPIVIGYLVKGTNFSPAIAYIASTAILGAVCFGFIVGKVERIRE